MNTIINTSDAPDAVGPYSQAVKVGQTVYLSGQIGLIPGRGVLAEGLEQQVRQAFTNLQAVLLASGTDFGHVVKLSLFVTDLAQFALINQIMTEFVSLPYPARSCMQVAALPKGALFEVEAVAVLD